MGMPAHIRFLWPICPLNFVQNYYETGVAYCCLGVDFIQKICYYSIGKWYGAVYFNVFFTMPVSFLLHHLSLFLVKLLPYTMKGINENGIVGIDGSVGPNNNF